jgi:hypothetical protein
LIGKNGSAKVEIYLSVGVSTLVALMAADRTDPGSDRTMAAVSERREIAHIMTEPDAGYSPAAECDLSWW